MDASHWTRKSTSSQRLTISIKKMGIRDKRRNDKKSQMLNLDSTNSSTISSSFNINVSIGAAISMPKMSKDCKCEYCVADKKVEEFFTKKRYWWTNRWLWWLFQSVQHIANKTFLSSAKKKSKVEYKLVSIPMCDLTVDLFNLVYNFCGSSTWSIMCKKM